MMFNVWYQERERWTNNGQDHIHPPSLSWEKAKELADQLNIGFSTKPFRVRELLPYGKPGSYYDNQDPTCPQCGNLH
jgi:hypothetical protein